MPIMKSPQIRLNGTDNNPSAKITNEQKSVRP